MKSMISIVLFCAAVLASAQTVNTYNVSLSPVAVSSKVQSVAGTEAGGMITVTPNFDIGNMDVVAPGNNFQYFSGRVNYRIPYLSNKLNNLSSTINGLKFQFGLTASAGLDRITTGGNHFGFTAGGFANYSFDQGAHYTLGAEVQYAKWPGLNNNTFTVALGPAVHF